MAKRAAAAVAWDQKHGARRDAELERVMAMRERDELDYFWVEVRPQSPAPLAPQNESARRGRSRGPMGRSGADYGDRLLTQPFPAASPPPTHPR